MIRESIGSYRILRKLGEGGMGEVYEAVDDRIKRRVAIKLLRSHHLGDSDTAARFFTEALAVNLIEHPGVVQVHEYGHLEDNCSYLVMEYLNGETLAERIKKRAAPMPESEVLSLGQQLASALVAAHDRAIVHRDLKPANIMLVEDPGLPDGERVKLLDFGIAKLATEGLGPAKQPTLTGKLIGTPRYMSPEQCRGQRDLDGKSDVYSLGVMLYELLAGRPPFVGVSEYDVLAKHLYDQPVPLGDLRASVSKPLLALVHRMLDKKKDNRPPMKEVFAELKGYRRAWAGQAEPQVAVPTPTSVDRVVPSAQSSDPTESGFASSRVPAPADEPGIPDADADAAAEAAPTMRAPAVRPKPQGPRRPNPPAPGPAGPEPTLIAGGPNATTVPVSIFNRKAQDKLRRAQSRRQLQLVGVSAAVLLVLVIYLICR
jgi:serine/threonine protein kinase